MLWVLLGGCIIRLHFNCDSEVPAVGTGSTSIYIHIYIHIYSGIDALPVNYRLHSGVCRFVPITDTAISDHRS